MAKKAYVGIPNTYTRVEYIESHGGQFIDTGIKGANDLRFVADFEVTEFYSDFEFLFGARDAYHSYEFTLAVKSGQWFSGIGSTDSKPTSPSAQLNTRYTVDKNRNVLTINGVTTTQTAPSAFTGSQNVLIFNIHGPNVATVGAKIKLYSFKLYKNDVLVRDFVPCVDYSGVACLYDRITDKPYYNLGEATGFTASSTTYERFFQGYIETDGNEYFDTGATPNQDFGFELDFIPLETPTTSNAPAYVNAGGAGGNQYQNQRVGVNVYYSASTPNGELQFGSEKIDNKLTIGVRQKISIINKVATLPDGTTHTFTGGDFTSPNTFILFGAHNSPEINRRSKMKFYGLKIYNGTTLVKDYVPALNTDNNICLYDRVSNTYSYINGSGETPYINSVARNVTNMYVGVKDDYLESDGTQWIDTGIIPSGSTRIISVQATEGSSVLSGSDASDGSRFKWGTNSDGKLYIGYGQYNMPSNNIFGSHLKKNTFLVRYKEQTCTDDDYGTTIISGANTYGDTYNDYSITLFGKRNSDFIVGNSGKMRLYSCRIYEGNPLQMVRDFVPALDANDVPCLYDNVTETYFYNQGTGNFGYSIGNKARVVQKAYVGVGGVARQFWNIGNDKILRKIQVPYPVVTYQQSGICCTKDYGIIAGGFDTANSRAPVKKVYAIDENGTFTSAPDLDTACAHSACMNFNGVAIFCGGKSGNGSGSSRTNQCVTYNNSLVKTTLSNLTTATYCHSIAGTNTHFIVAFGSTYSSESTSIQSYNASYVKTTLANSTTSESRHGKVGARVGDYLVFCGGNNNTAGLATWVYDENNVKLTYPYPFVDFWVATKTKCDAVCGAEVENYAMFSGGANGSSSSYATNVVVAYNKDLAVTRFTRQLGVWRENSASIGKDCCLIGGGQQTDGTYPSTMKKYRNLVPEETIDIGIAVSTDFQYMFGANEKFMLTRGTGSTSPNTDVRLFYLG